MAGVRRFRKRSILGARLTSKIPFFFISLPFRHADYTFFVLFCFVFCTTGFYLPIKVLFSDGYTKRLLFEMIILLLSFLTMVGTATYVQQCMQWRKWRKIARGLEIGLDAKSGLLENGDCISGHISWDGRALDRKAGGLGLDPRGRTSTQGATFCLRNG